MTARIPMNLTENWGSNKKSRFQKSQESRATEFQLGDGNVEEQIPSQD